MAFVVCSQQEEMIRRISIDEHVQVAALLSYLRKRRRGISHMKSHVSKSLSKFCVYVVIEKMY
jgi:hypothetical protein